MFKIVLSMEKIKTNIFSQKMIVNVYSKYTLEYICDINILSTDKKKCYPIMLKIGKKGRKPDRQCRKQARECL